MRRTYTLIAALVFLAAAINVAVVGCEASAHPIQVYQDGGRIGVAESVINCVGDVRCTVANKAVRISATIPDAGSGGGSARSYISAKLECTQASPGGFTCWTSSVTTPSTQIQHHIAFSIVNASVGSDITLDTSTAYRITDNSDSTGRFTLAANKTYLLRAHLGQTVFASTNCYGAFGWFNSDTGEPIGSGTIIVTSTWSPSNTVGAGSFEAVFSPSTSTRVEVRIWAENCMTQLVEVGAQADGGYVSNGPHAFIEVLQ